MDEENDETKIDSEENIDDSVLSEEYQGEAIKKLKEKVKLAEGKAKDYLDSWQRAQADFANLRKRDEESRMEFLKYASFDVVGELLPVLDSFNSALGHDLKVVDPIYNQMVQILKARGLKEIDCLHEIFDPRLHEAVGIIETDKKEDDHKILEVFQKGYTLNDRVLRPAKVRVGDYINN